MPDQKIKAILEAAVKIEEQSYELYKMAQKKVDYLSSQKFLGELAQEEIKHKEKLLAIIENRRKIAELGESISIQDLKLVDIMKDVPLAKDADYQKILIYAAKREKITHDYYQSLALGLENTDTGNLFSKLAQEELIHKNRLEREYDDYILKEN
ncbi:MAG: ferritin family protein [Candidatus Bathyarchaeota archaeon]|nr:MAG: ferritin family protein [Candidatus Bathyarchaeota archaeon]